MKQILLAAAKELQSWADRAQETPTDHQQIIDAVKACWARGGTLFFTGIGKNSFVAQRARASWASWGLRVDFIDPVHGLHGDMGTLRPEDLVIGLSKSGRTSELLLFLQTIEARLQVNVGMISIGAGVEPLFNLSIDLPAIQELDPEINAPTLSLHVLGLWLDAVGTVLYQSDGFTKAKFVKTHPGGAIGASLT